MLEPSELRQARSGPNGDAKSTRTDMIATRRLRFDRRRHEGFPYLHVRPRVSGHTGPSRFIAALVNRDHTSEFLSQPYLVPGLRLWKHEYVLLQRSLVPA